MRDLDLNEVIESYRKTDSLTSTVTLDWLKRIVNPILMEIHPSLKINWACSTCVKSYMNTLIAWKDRKDAEKPKPKKRKPRKTVAKKIVIKNK